MTGPMGDERLAEISEQDATCIAYIDDTHPNSLLHQRRELLAEVKRLRAMVGRLDTEWAIHVEEPNQLPVIAIIDTEANARAGAAITRAKVTRRAVVTAKRRLVGPWNPVTDTQEQP